MNKYFFAQDGDLIIDIQSNNEPPVKVIGEVQYSFSAYVTLGSEYKPGLAEENLTSVTPLQIIGPIFDTEGIYTFDIELRTIDNANNVIYVLSGFHYEINFKKSS